MVQCDQPHFFIFVFKLDIFCGPITKKSFGYAINILYKSLFMQNTLQTKTKSSYHIARYSIFRLNNCKDLKVRWLMIKQATP